MAAESIAAFRKPGFPRLSTTESAFRTLIEYIGATATLTAAEPDPGVAWGDFVGTVTTTELFPTENPAISELVVTVELEAESPEEEGTLESETYEIEWVVVGRSMYEHPQFAIGFGGANALTSEDISHLANWQKEEDTELKAAYSFASEFSPDIELSTNARLFARGIELGLIEMEDFAPVTRKTSTYVNGPPPQTEAGQKQDPPSFPRLPAGYEWRKSADRSVTAGKRTKWDRSEEWTGAKKVLYDRDEIFWEAP